MEATSDSTQLLCKWTDASQFAGRIVAYKTKLKNRDNFVFEGSRKYFGLISKKPELSEGEDFGYLLSTFVKANKTPNDLVLNDTNLKLNSLKMRIATLEEVKNLQANQTAFRPVIMWDMHLGLATNSPIYEKKTAISDGEQAKKEAEIGDFVNEYLSILSIFSSIYSKPSNSSDKKEFINVTGLIDDGEQKLFKEICEKNPEIINKTNLYGETPLCYACSVGKLGIVQFLLGKEADVYIKMQIGGTTAMHAAAFNGSLECVKALYEKDPKTAEAKSKNGSSVLYWAGWSGHADVVSFLINEANANLHDANDEGMTPFLIAARHGRKEVVEMFYNKDPSTVKAKNKEGRDAYWLSHRNVFEFILALPELDVEQTRATERLVWNK